jgi:hypothetical protein
MEAEEGGSHLVFELHAVFALTFDEYSDFPSVRLNALEDLFEFEISQQ